MRQLTTRDDLLTIFAAPGPMRGPGEPIPPRPSQAVPDRTADPSAIPGPAILATFEALFNIGYGGRQADAIVAYLQREGTLAGAPCLDATSEAIVERAYVAALPAVPFDDAAWGSDDDLDDLDLVVPIDPDGPGPDLAGEEEPTGEYPPVPVEPPDEWQGNAEAGWAYHPTPEDEAAYRAMLAEEEARAAAVEAERAEALGWARLAESIEDIRRTVHALRGLAAV